jgi:predicted kinase
MERNPTAKLVIVCGLPGSGKTTHAKVLETGLGAVRLCPDDWMDAVGIDLYDSGAREKIEALQWLLAQRLLALGQKVVIEWGTWGRSERDVLRLGARALGAQVELHFLDEEIDTLFARISTRNREDPPITRQMLEDWMVVFERPTPEEMELFD